jgi:cell envelope opacity-associated protein A
MKFTVAHEGISDSNPMSSPKQGSNMLSKFKVGDSVKLKVDIAGRYVSAVIKKGTVGTVRSTNGVSEYEVSWPNGIISIVYGRELTKP